MDKSKIYLDLSKCTEEERKHIFSLLPDCYWNGQYVYNAEFAKHLKYNSHHQSWVTGLFSNDKRLKELTYPEFIKLFEGGEGEKIYKPMTEFPPTTEGEHHSKMVLVFDEDLDDFDFGFYHLELKKWVVMGDFQMNLICWRHIEKPMYEDVQEYPTVLTD